MAENATSDKFPNSLKYYVQMCMKITKIVAILRLKCTKFDFDGALPQTPLGELTALPQTS